MDVVIRSAEGREKKLYQFFIIFLGLRLLKNLYTERERFSSTYVIQQLSRLKSHLKFVAAQNLSKWNMPWQLDRRCEFTQSSDECCRRRNFPKGQSLFERILFSSWTVSISLTNVSFSSSLQKRPHLKNESSSMPRISKFLMDLVSAVFP